MNNPRACWFILFTFVLLMATAGYFSLPSEEETPIDFFQHWTGGIGLAPSVSPAWTFFSMPPNIEVFCENELWPIPGLPCYNPNHGALVVELPPFERAAIGE